MRCLALSRKLLSFEVLGQGNMQLGHTWVLIICMKYIDVKEFKLFHSSWSSWLFNFRMFVSSTIFLVCLFIEHCFAFVDVHICDG